MSIKRWNKLYTHLTLYNMAKAVQANTDLKWPMNEHVRVLRSMSSWPSVGETAHVLQCLVQFLSKGSAIAQPVSRQLPTSAARVRAQVRSCGICGGQSGTEAGFSEYFDFPCQFSFHRLLHTHHLSSGAGIIGQIVADVPSGLSLTPPQETK
jgi:hypothetical protein